MADGHLSDVVPDQGSRARRKRWRGGCEGLAFRTFCAANSCWGRRAAEAGLVGSGLIVINPPFTLGGELRSFMPVLGRLLSPDATNVIDWLTRERRPRQLVVVCHFSTRKKCV